MICTSNQLIHPILADCSDAKIASFTPSLPSTYDPNSDEIPILPEVFTPRPGIHYVVTPKSNFKHDNPQINCPTGSSLTYIKSTEEWEDWKFIRGIKLIYYFFLKQSPFLYILIHRSLWKTINQ